MIPAAVGTPFTVWHAMHGAPLNMRRTARGVARDVLVEGEAHGRRRLRDDPLGELRARIRRVDVSLTFITGVATGALALAPAGVLAPVLVATVVTGALSCRCRPLRRRRAAHRERLLVRDLRIELRRRHREHLEPHVRVRRAAVLGAEAVPGERSSRA